VPTAAINPITIADQGGIECLDQVGEFLVFTDHSLKYHPWLAESWQPNADATVWTFKIRQGVRFNDGKPMTVDDVVYSFKSQSNPKSSANALSIFGGTLVPDGVVKVDDATVAFHLERPDGGFIDAVSNDNYNVIIVPNGYDYAKYQTSFIGTGRFKKASYTPNVGATFVRNPYYWGSAGEAREARVHLLPERGVDDGRPGGGRHRRQRRILYRLEPAALERRLQRHQADGELPP
jgi:peptide/nickel transport system substrate-binding protein